VARAASHSDPLKVNRKGWKSVESLMGDPMQCQISPIGLPDQRTLLVLNLGYHTNSTQSFFYQSRSFHQNDRQPDDSAARREILARVDSLMRLAPKEQVQYEIPDPELPLDNVLLDQELFVSYMHGRLKKKRVLLLTRHLMFLRENVAGCHTAVYKVPLEDLLLVTFRERGAARPILMVYWQERSSGTSEVTAAEMVFDFDEDLRTWASYLAAIVTGDSESEGYPCLEDPILVSKLPSAWDVLCYPQRLPGHIPKLPSSYQDLPGSASNTHIILDFEPNPIRE